MQPPFVLVDGSSYLYRAFHAMPPLTNPAGEPTGAVYGVINMLRKLLNETKATNIAVIFDTKGDTFRDALFEKYKAQRPPMPPELVAQLEPIHKIIAAMGIPILMIEGVEADDVIATLAKQAEQHKIHTLISTGDKDMAQIVSPVIHLVNTMTEAELDPEGVEKKFGVKPEQIIDLLALTGDTSDNIPGVPNVGPKTAAKWLQKYQTLDNIIKHAEEITGKVGENLRENLGQLNLSKQLVTLKCDVALDVTPTQLIKQAPDYAQLIPLFEHLAFKGWLAEAQAHHLGGAEKPTTSKTATQPSEIAYELILAKDKTQFQAWIKTLQAADAFAFDTETTGLDSLNAKVVGVSFAAHPGHAAYVPFGHDYEGAPAQLTEQEVLGALKPLLENPALGKIGHHLKYDMRVLLQHNIALQGIRFDTMLESYLVASTGTRHDLDSLALKYLHHQNITFEDVAGKGKKQVTFNQVEVDKAGHYAAEDADITLRLHEYLWPELASKPGLKKVFEEIEIPLVSVLARMENIGVLIDADCLKQQSEALGKKITAYENEIYTLAGETFNIDSPKQLQQILFEKLHLPVIEKTPSGQPSTAEPILQELALSFPLPKLIINYRSLNKLKTTYTDRLPEQIDPRTGRVHTSYHQAVTATGRLSSSDPNLQNIPVRTEEGRAIRKAFIAPEGYQIVALDYSQIELRIMAHLSGDKRLMAAFTDHADVHRATAAEVFGVPLDKVTELQRRRAKAINFGLIYGMSAFGLAKQIESSRKEAEEYMAVYFKRYPGVAEYMEKTRDVARRQGYVETILGRRLYLSDINASNRGLRMAAERMAINAPMQGTAADIIKKAMIDIDHYLTSQKIPARMIMQVHDELVFEVKRERVQEIMKALSGLMEHAVSLKVPLTVGAGVGENWEAAH